MFTSFSPSMNPFDNGEQERRERQRLNDHLAKEATTVPSTGLKAFYTSKGTCHIGVDEVGRGALIGRVYTAAVVLPDPVANPEFDFSGIYDSKRIKSKQRMIELAEYIKMHAVAWEIAYVSEATIDEINIHQATQVAMHRAASGCIQKLIGLRRTEEYIEEDDALPPVHLWIDGNTFNPLRWKDEQVSYTTIEKGDNTLANIAAASILAKAARDTYVIEELCGEAPELREKYRLELNMGYGTPRHMDGIRAYGTSQWHRHTFGTCREYAHHADANDANKILNPELATHLKEQDAIAVALANEPKQRRGRRKTAVPPLQPTFATEDLLKSINEFTTTLNNFLVGLVVNIDKMAAAASATTTNDANDDATE